MILNGSLTSYGIPGVDLEWIRKSPKLAEYEKEPWAVAHGFEREDFGKCQKSLQTP